MDPTLPASAENPGPRRFPLVRSFSLAALVCLVAVAVLLGAIYQHQALESLTQMGESHNVTLTKTFSNFLGQRFEPLVAWSRGRSPAELQANPELPALRQAVAELMRDTQAVKVKVYNPAGVTVFSTDLRQVGESRADNPGFVAALAGKVSTELVHKDQFDAFEGKIEHRDLIFSYLPVDDATGRRHAVFELYRDVTPLVEHMEATRRMVMTGVAASMVTLYALLFLIVWRAQVLLDRQGRELAASFRQIREANQLLDQRVSERTAELTATNLSLETEVQERRTAEQKLAFLAHHDPLTGLPNRILLHERIGLAISRARREQGGVAVLFIDLDNFKHVNNTLGHPVGDILLRQVADELARHVRGVDTLARLGGDEFILLTEVAGRDEAEAVARKMLDLLHQPYKLVDTELYVGASIGVSLFPGDGQDGPTLIRNADTAMYQAKADGRGSYRFYHPAMTAFADERLRLDSMLRKAMDEGELAVVYQPQVDLRHGHLIGVEALLRWQHPTLGDIAPSRFIPVAEESGFIGELGAWVLRQSCVQMRAWLDRGVGLPKVAVNVSAKQLERGSFVDTVRAALEDTGLPAERLELEITESAIMLTQNAHELLGGLRALGVLLSIDDFGTGYSSLSYLKQLPVHKLKIDRSFVRDLEAGGNDMAIVRSIIALARTMGLSTLAEGVESAGQAELLAGEGCEQAQGYLYGRPVSAEQVERCWRAQHAASGSSAPLSRSAGGAPGRLPQPCTQMS